ncbi:hypothetical protein Q4489_13495 [Thalassotalea sp. 1_MG-2023]|uniref:hypothetical protein n=1 Tax=Thalassotalea sp. 1_MG-2023 TaxID=3062680 RepID=UPI0026E44085|nr:hypothetical protein [Thalassotalea sp. 1_MG-2023]MDO6428029.1 hypothetical protein [Thalassotalea sp. 1_MG-2023]
MDVLADLLPPSYLVKSETTAKDRQPEQQNPQDEQSSEENNEATHQEKKKKTRKKAYFVERRSGEDRRLHQKNRGRWLDSRLNKDRRKANTKTAIKLSI